MMVVFFADIKNTSRNIFQLRSEYFLMIIKMRNGSYLLSFIPALLSFNPALLFTLLF